MSPSRVGKNPIAQKRENPRVLSIKRPNRRKKVILAANRKQEAEHVVNAPEVTEIPTYNTDKISRQISCKIPLM